MKAVTHAEVFPLLNIVMVLITIVVGAVVAASPRTSVLAAGGGLHVQGNQILDANNAPIRLIGVNHSGTEYACDQGSSTPYGWGLYDHDLSATEIQAIRSWNVNAVRIPLNEDCWLGINNVNAQYGGANYQNYISSLVSRLHASGLYVILDLHWSSAGSYPAQGQQPMPDQDHSLAFWQSVATTFKNDPNTVFDLFNEPFIYTSDTTNPSQDTWACWLNGCSFKNNFTTTGNRFSYTWQATGMQPLINAVRATGANNLIIVGGLDWANDLSGWLSHQPTDPDHNLAVSWHSYPGQGCSTSTCWTNVVLPIAQQLPVVVGETGDSVCQSVTFDNNFLPWADQHALSYLGWTWNAWQDCNDVLISSYAGTPTANYGLYFHDHLLSLPQSSLIPSSSNTAPSPTSVPPTSTVTLTATSTATATATSMATVAATSTATPPIATATSSVPLNSTTLLFTDGFEQDAIGAVPQRWSVSGTNAGFSVQQKTTHVYAHSGWTAITTAGSPTWTNYTSSVQMLPNNWASEQDGVLVRVKDSSNYYQVLYVGGTTLRVQKVVNGQASTLASTALSMSSSWHTLQVTALGTALTVAVDGTPKLSVTDSTFPAGAIGLAANSPVSFDAVQVISR